MYFSSLSDSTLEEYSQSDDEADQEIQFPTTYRNPFYATMGDPLVYYAQISPGNRRKRSRNNNINCFVKAFRWYTQDHVPNKRNKYCGSDIPGFAHWLDTKYDEFVTNSQMDRGSYKLKLKQISTFEGTKTPTFTVKKTSNLSKHSDLNEKELQCFEYIMQPKELVRLGSECCHLTPTSCCDISNVTITSTDTRGKKPKIKSRSLSCICQDNREPIDLSPVHEEVRSKKQHKSRNKSRPGLSSKKESSKSKHIKESYVKNSNRDCCCQCPDQKITKVNVGIQCENENIKANKFVCEKCAASCSITSKKSKDSLKIQNKKATKQLRQGSVTTQKNVKEKLKLLCECDKDKGTAIAMVDADVEHCFPHTCCDYFEKNIKMESPKPFENKCSVCRRTEKIKGTILKESPSSLLLKFHGSKTVINTEQYNQICDAVQTSDHSIHLEKETGQDYPLFMKIICADKLNEKHNFCKCTS